MSNNISGSNSISSDLSLATGGNQYVIQSDAGTLTLNTITNNTGDTSTNPRYVYLQGAGNGQVTGIIGSGTGTCPVAINKSGAGTWTLFAANTYAGATTINGGTLSLGATGSIANTSGITLNNSAILDVSGLSAAFTIGGGEHYPIAGWFRYRSGKLHIRRYKWQQGRYFPGRRWSRLEFSPFKTVLPWAAAPRAP